MYLLPISLSFNFQQLRYHNFFFLQFSTTSLPQIFFFFLYSNFSNLTATIPIKFSLSSPTILATWLPQLPFSSWPHCRQLSCHNCCFPLSHSSGHSSNHLGSFGFWARILGNVITEIQTLFFAIFSQKTPE